MAAHLIWRRSLTLASLFLAYSTKEIKCVTTGKNGHTAHGETVEAGI